MKKFSQEITRRLRDELNQRKIIIEEQVENLKNLESAIEKNKTRIFELEQIFKEEQNENI